MNLVSKRPKILVFIGNYLPGYKAGGILRSMVNTVENLCDDMEFWIVTRDRDLGDITPYAEIKEHQWQSVGSAMVYYLTPKSQTLRNIKELIINTEHDILYLNSFFDPFTIKVLLIRKFGRLPFNPIIVAPRGEFAWASLRFKYPKKIIFIQIARLIGLYQNITWHASSELESIDIVKVMCINDSTIIHNALDLPTQQIEKNYSTPSTEIIREFEGLNLIFLSRISPEKNLDIALQILSRVKTNVCFDIYGPCEDIKYWKQCQELIKLLPNNIKVKYLGNVNPNQVVQIFGYYDLFLFPSGGENYGHVIAESLRSGTPVLISDKTPWNNLQKDNFGWDIPLDQIETFVEVIEKYALISIEERSNIRLLIKSKIEKHLLNPVVREANKQLFLKYINLNQTENPL